MFGPDKVEVCHVPPKKDKTITVDKSAIWAHLAHGDTVGPCAAAPAPFEGVADGSSLRPGSDGGEANSGVAEKGDSTGDSTQSTGPTPRKSAAPIVKRNGR